MLIPFGRLHCVMWFFSSLEIGLQILDCINQNQNPGLHKSGACVDLSIADSGEVVVDKIQQKDDLDKGSFGSKINHPSALFDLKLVKEKIAKLGYGFNYSLFGNQQCLNFGHTWRWKTSLSGQREANENKGDTACVPKSLLNPSIFQPIGQFDQFAILCPLKGHAFIVGSMINGHFIHRLTIIWLIELSGLAYFHILIDLISSGPWWYITSVTFLLSLSKQVHLPNRKFQCHQPRLEEFLWLWTFILLLLVAHFFSLPQSSISIRGMPKLPTNCSSIIVAMGPTCLATFIFHLQSVLNECDVLSFVAGFRCK